MRSLRPTAVGLLVMVVGWSLLLPQRLDYAAHTLAGAGVAIVVVGVLVPAASSLRGPPPWVSAIGVGVALGAAVGSEAVTGGFDIVDVAVSGLGACVGSQLLPDGAPSRFASVVVGVGAIGAGWVLRLAWAQGSP